MRRDSPTGLQENRTKEFGPHPVPTRAKGYGHLASYFVSEGDRDLGGRMTGREGAREFTRHLRPAHAAGFFP